jgi:hypothetical protein
MEIVSQGRFVVPRFVVPVFALAFLETPALRFAAPPCMLAFILFALPMPAFMFRMPAFILPMPALALPVVIALLFKVLVLVPVVVPTLDVVVVLVVVVVEVFVVFAFSLVFPEQPARNAAAQTTTAIAKTCRISLLLETI